MDALSSQIDKFLAAPAFAVFGASDEFSKYGHKVYACYLQQGRKAYPVNPRIATILGNPAFKGFTDLPERVDSISIITPPVVTERIVKDAVESGVKNIWMQPGAESAAAIKQAQDAGLNVIHGGPCLLTVLGYHE